MYFPFKEQVRKQLPNLFVRIRSIKDQFVIEYKTIRQVGLYRVLQKIFYSKSNWASLLPMQKIFQYKVDIESLDELCRLCPTFIEGGHTFYFKPNSFEKTDLQMYFKYIPENCGFKFTKRRGGIDSPFSHEDKTCNAHTFLSPSHKELILVHAIFSNLDIGPRLYDLCEIQFRNGDVHVVYLLKHIEGVQPSDQECQEFIMKLRECEARDLIRLSNWNGYNDMDFQCPGCNNNLITESVSKSLKYVDLQNFSLGDYYSYLKEQALEASHASHFGHKSLILGGEYLYQEVPGLNMPAKRSPSIRFDNLRHMLFKCGVSLHGKLVIDIGCNIGLMGAQYLKEGAGWLHGFDMPQVIDYTAKMLLAVGCTRFSTKGVLLGPDFSIIDHLPQNVQNEIEGCVISYLAIRGHIGWIQELKTIPWEVIIYEGHEEEDIDMSRQFISELKKIRSCSIIQEGFISDANSSSRYVAIIKSDEIVVSSN